MTKIVQIFKRRPKEKPRDLKEIMAGHTDDELYDVLKKRAYYTDEAAEIAIAEAIKRGLIHSEQDLFDERFSEENMDFTWFPLPDKPESKERIRRSLGRSLVLCGLIPLIFGFLEINSGNEWQGRLILAFGITWIFLSSQILRYYRNIWFYLLLVADIACFAFVSLRLFLAKSILFMDLFIAVILFLLIAYALFFIRRIDLSSRR